MLKSVWFIYGKIRYNVEIQSFYISPNQTHFVPKTATLFIHLLTNVKKEIMPKDLGSAGDDFTVEMRLFKQLVYVRTVAIHFCGEPFYCPTLFIENRFDDMSYMKICHLCIKIS